MYFQELAKYAASLVRLPQCNVNLGKVQVGHVEARGHTNALFQGGLCIGKLSISNIEHAEIVQGVTFKSIPAENDSPAPVSTSTPHRSSSSSASRIGNISSFIVGFTALRFRPVQRHPRDPRVELELHCFAARHRLVRCGHFLAPPCKDDRRSYTSQPD